jgi:nitric oxide reductase subunit B
VSGLILAQIVMGVVTAHYGVDGGGLFGIPLASVLPYSVTRTWHLQLGLFWIATAWLAAGLYIAPAVCGYEPKFRFYGAALGAGKHTNLAMAEYWRWWVVHLWVQGFFEVFATVVIAFLFARLKLVRLKAAGAATVTSATIFLGGGIIGTLHHLYFSGTPTVVLALGSVFSALEVVPLLFIGVEAWENLKLSQATPWVHHYRWPIYFFVAVAFWNLLGAGVFGFMINPPVALYYMQGLNTTPVHGHAAHFGVYGMLGMGLMLFSLRAMQPGRQWREGTIRFAFWSINIGLLAMVTLSLLPVGLMQTWASVQHGYWFARSAEFM